LVYYPAMLPLPEAPDSAMQRPLLEVRNLVKEYASDGRVVRVVDGVSFEIRAGETLGLVGESGSGKSTVARMVLGLLQPTYGDVIFQGEPLPLSSSSRMRNLRRHMQIVFQDPYAALNPRMTIGQILEEPFAIHREKPAGGLNARLRELLKRVGLDESVLPRYPHEFSGGQRQRINIARGVALNPRLLVLDEPVSALDVSVGAQVINLLRELQQTLGLTYLFISHSMPLVRYLCDRVAVMQGGKLVELGDCIQVCDKPQSAYTEQLIAATLELPAGYNPT